MSEENSKTKTTAAIREGLTSALHWQFLEGHQIKVLRNGCRIFPAMLGAIEKADKEVDFLTFVYWQGEIAKRFASTLAKKAREGVRVRVLLDSFGAKKMHRSLIELMKSAGVEVRWFRPISFKYFWRNNRRTHRKVLVCDRQIAFTGGVGIAEEWEGDARNPDEWRETHFQLKGPAVSGLHSAFYTNWMEAGGRLEEVDLVCPAAASVGNSPVQVVPKASSIGWTTVMSIFLILLRLAKTNIRITTPYFVPGTLMTGEIVAACQRGVRVEILMPGKRIDERIVQQAGEARYRELLEAGVNIWRYVPTMIHVKSMTVDGVIASVGSANFNQRSMQRDEEVCLNIADPEIVAELDRHFEDDIRQAEEYSLHQWKQRSLYQRSKEAVSSLFRSEM